MMLSVTVQVTSHGRWTGVEEKRMICEPYSLLGDAR